MDESDYGHERVMGQVSCLTNLEAVRRGRVLVVREIEVNNCSRLNVYRRQAEMT